MRLHELMQKEVWETFPDECLADAAARMRDHGVGSLPVMDGDVLLGILTDRDLLHAVADAAAAEETRVVSYMSSAPIVASPGDDTTMAARMMVEHDVRHLPVVVGARVIGIVSARDLLVLHGWPYEAAPARRRSG